MIQTGRIEITLNERPIAFEMALDSEGTPDVLLSNTFTMGQVPESELVFLLGNVLKEGDFVVDAGANIGFFTLLMWKYVGEQGSVLAIEPGSNNLPRLYRTLELNKTTNITLSDKVLWSKSGPIEFFLYNDSGHNSVKADVETDKGTEQQATTLDELCGDRTPKLIKLDIEGAEVEALKGASKLLSRHPPFIVCEMNEAALARCQTSPAEMRAFMRDQGYQTFMMYPDGYLPGLIPDRCTLQPMRMNSNILFSTLEDIADSWPVVKW